MGMKAFFYASVMALTVFATASSLANEPASFDCAKASGVDEKLICSDDLLAHADRSLSGFYKTLLASIRHDIKQTDKEDQGKWIKQRNTQCGITKNTEVTTANRQLYVKCFLKSYGQRGQDLFDRANSVAIEDEAFSHLQELAQSGDADAQAVLGAVIAVDGSSGMMKWKNQEKSAEWLKKAAHGGQLLTQEDFSELPHVLPDPLDEICNDGVGGLTENEKNIVIKLIDIDQRPELVGFNCREPSAKNHLIIGTNIGSNLGNIFSVNFANGKAEVNTLENGQYYPSKVVFDKSKEPFLLFSASYMHQGPLSSWSILMRMRSGKSQTLVSVFEDSNEGGCGSSEWYHEATASKISDFHLEMRPDGLENIIYKIEVTDCKTNKTTAKTLLFTPTDNGFTTEK